METIAKVQLPYHNPGSNEDQFSAPVSNLPECVIVITKPCAPHLVAQADPAHLGVDIHLLVIKRHFLHGDVSADIVLLDNLLVQHRCRALGEGITLQLSTLLVGLDVVPLKHRLVLGDDGDIHVGSGTQIVEDTSHDGVTGQLDGIRLGHLGLPLGLEHTHGRQATTAHGDVGQLVGAAVCVDGEEVGAGGVAASDDQVGADMALVPEEVLLEEGHAGDDAGFAAGGERVQLELGGDEGGGELSIGGGTSTGTPDLGGDVVELLAVLVGDDGARGGSGIGCNHDTAVKNASHDGRTSAGRLGERYSSGVEGRIAVVVGEVEAWHRG